MDGPSNEDRSSGSNSLSDGRNNNNSRLSTNTRIINKVTQVQKMMENQKQEDNSAKITQIRIHYNNQTQKQPEKIQVAKKPVSNTSPSSPGVPKGHSLGQRGSSPGVPKVQDIDGIEEPSYKSSYGQEHFLPLKKLGSGSFGDVYLVRDKNSGKLYAMKTLSKRKILG